MEESREKLGENREEIRKKLGGYKRRVGKREE
jgi:hypothetical protein